MIYWNNSKGEFMKKILQPIYEDYSNLMMKNFPESDLEFSNENVENIFVYIYKMIEIIKKTGNILSTDFDQLHPEILYTLDNLLISLPIFKKKMTYLLLRNLVEAVIKSTILELKANYVESFRDNKEIIKKHHFYDNNKHDLDVLFNKYSELSSLIHFSGEKYEINFLSHKLKLECSNSDFNIINSTLRSLLNILITLLSKQENQYPTSLKIYLQDILSNKEYSKIIKA